jgi:hypothetical protein
MAAPSAPSSPEDSDWLYDLWETIVPASPPSSEHTDENTETEDVHEAERKRRKCLPWWERREFGIAVESLLYEPRLECATWLNIECFLQQDYQRSMEPAIVHIKNFIIPKLRGKPFMVGYTTDIHHRWNRKDLDKKNGNRIGYVWRGFRNMYIVHVSTSVKADLSIEKFEKDPERQQQLIYEDTSVGRMEMQLCKKDGTGLGHLENCLNKGKGNEAATNKNGPGVTYIVTDLI